ncbi:M56 family metallopeptidase [Nguyenibacter vanlangensis]|uniref:M56 family metallopeptidase n=1 Tax=Nguyenibacter vanlangensis TaxID=1216886 RepID=A0A7Y7IUM4_9PROT|nr:M56 family metallopeptidase [Nguyenibacter vanlangensis]NVN10452.1 M56 family metallopeptidase [Nguyenibacter vanlangensis]
MIALAHHLIEASVQSALVVIVLALGWRWVPRAAPHVWAALWLWALALSLLALFLSPIRLHLLPSVPVAPIMPVDFPAAVRERVASTYPAEAGHPQGGNVWATALATIWVVGVLAKLLVATQEYARVRDLLSAATKSKRHATLYASLGHKHGVSRLPQIVVSGDAVTPFVTGLFSPVIVLPTRQILSESDISLLLGHELAHVARRDLQFGLIALLADIVFWFHPGIRYAVCAYRDAREMACDTRVLARQAVPAHRYGAMLLQLGVEAPGIYGIAAASRQFKVLKTRLHGLKNQYTTTGSRFASMLVLPMVVICLPWRLMAASPSNTLDSPPLTSPPAYAVITQTTRGHHSEVNSQTLEQSNRIAALSARYPNMFWLDTGTTRFLFTDAETITQAGTLIAPGRQRWQRYSQDMARYWSVHGPLIGLNTRLKLLDQRQAQIGSTTSDAGRAELTQIATEREKIEHVREGYIEREAVLSAERERAEHDARQQEIAIEAQLLTLAHSASSHGLAVPDPAQ